MLQICPLLDKNVRKSNPAKIDRVDWGDFPPRRQYRKKLRQSNFGERKSALCDIAPIAPHLITLSSEVIFENAGIPQIRGKLGLLKIKYSPKPGSKSTIPRMDTPLERDLLSGLWNTFDPLIDPLAAFLPFTAIY